jgi:hypothetical protein
MSTIDLVGLEEHRRLASTLSDRVWELLDQPDRSAIEVDELIHTAHAARFHWGQLQPPDHGQLATSEWQISRMYTLLDRAEPARWHAERSLANCVDGRIEGFLLGAAYEALARACRLQGDDAAVHRYLRLGREAAAQVTDTEDRQMLLDDLAAVDAWALSSH